MRLVRPVFQTVTLEIGAFSQNSAMQKALRRAGNMSESDWIAPRTQNDDYAIHVEAVLDHQKVYETSANPHRQIKEFRSGGGESYTTKYMILAADMKAWVGRILQQPWFIKTDQESQADLCSDWVEPINFILENDGLGGDGAQSAVGWETHRNDNVIDFPVSDLDQELVDSKS